MRGIVCVWLAVLVAGDAKMKTCMSICEAIFQNNQKNCQICFSVGCAPYKLLVGLCLEKNLITHCCFPLPLHVHVGMKTALCIHTHAPTTIVHSCWEHALHWMISLLLHYDSLENFYLKTLSRSSIPRKIFVFRVRGCDLKFVTHSRWCYQHEWGVFMSL